MFQQMLQLRFLHLTCFYNDFLYNPIFGNGESGNSYISCSTFLLGSNPLGSYNTSLYACNNSSSCCFCFLVHLSRAALPLIDSSSDQLSLKNNKTYFLLELINFLAWLTLTSENFYLPLCMLLLNDFPSLMYQYWLALLMNIASRMYMCGLPNTTPHTSRGTTSRSTSSIKSALVANLILHCFVTLRSTSLFTYPIGYGFG